MCVLLSPQVNIGPREDTTHIVLQPIVQGGVSFKINHILLRTLGLETGSHLLDDEEIQRERNAPAWKFKRKRPSEKSSKWLLE